MADFVISVLSTVVAIFPQPPSPMADICTYTSGTSTTWSEGTKLGLKDPILQISEICALIISCWFWLQKCKEAGGHFWYVSPAVNCKLPLPLAENTCRELKGPAPLPSLFIYLLFSIWEPKIKDLAIEKTTAYMKKIRKWTMMSWKRPRKDMKRP